MGPGKKMKHCVVGNNGIPCPRCGRPTEIREHTEVTARHLAQPFYYSRWFNCNASDCKTTLFMREEFRVFADPEQAQQAERFKAIKQQMTPVEPIRRGRDPLPGEAPPWD